MPYKIFREEKTPRHVPTLDNFGFEIPPKVNRVTMKKAKELQETMKLCYFCGMILKSADAKEIEKNKFACADCFIHANE